MKFCVVGTGYVGLSLSTLISRKYPVVAVDVIEKKVEMINSGKSPIVDKEISEVLGSGSLDLHATLNINECADADYIIIATPTNYDTETNSFDTSSVDSVIKNVTEINKSCTIVVKSTVPIGYVRRKYDEGFNRVIFSPEFLREGRALYDNLHPSRIIVGSPDKTLDSKAMSFGRVLSECAEDEPAVLLMGSTEAESVKLFSNTYLAMRVAFFNELDSFAEMHSLDSRSIIKGVSLDPRIGDYYNNPSFGYGGYCLPKDTKQLCANYWDTPNSLIKAIVESNDIRKRFIIDDIVKRVNKGSTIGIFRLTMKSGSDNFREASIIDVMRGLSELGMRVVIYEPTIADKFQDWEVVSDFDEFSSVSDIILANRMDKALEPFSEKVYCRDLFSRD